MPEEKLHENPLNGIALPIVPSPHKYGEQRPGIGQKMLPILLYFHEQRWEASNTQVKVPTGTTNVTLHFQMKQLNLKYVCHVLPRTLIQQE